MANVASDFVTSLVIMSCYSLVTEGFILMFISLVKTPSVINNKQSTLPGSEEVCLSTNNFKENNPPDGKNNNYYSFYLSGFSPHMAIFTSGH